MSYCTNYSLSVLDSNGRPAPKILRAFRSACEEAAEALEEDGSPGEGAPWYGHEKHLLAFSRKHPECLFVLQGEGEEPGDEWIKRFQDGQITVERSEPSEEDEAGERCPDQDDHPGDDGGLVRRGPHEERQQHGDDHAQEDGGKGLPEQELEAVGPDLFPGSRLAGSILPSASNDRCQACPVSRAAGPRARSALFSDEGKLAGKRERLALRLQV